MSTFFYIANDNRTDKTSISSVPGDMSGKFYYYDCTTDTLADVTSQYDPDVDTYITINVFNNPVVDPNEPVSDWEHDTSMGISGLPKIEETYTTGADKWHEAEENFDIKRNRAFIQLYECVPYITTKEPIGYNTLVRLTDVYNNNHYVNDPLRYESTATGYVTFHFQPEAKKGWLRCYLDTYAKLLSITNPDYDPSISTVLAPPDKDGWREVLNAEYEGMEFNFYPENCYYWWTLIEGLGNHIKVRIVYKNGTVAPISEWLPKSEIKTGLGAMSKFGVLSSLQSNVYRIEARYIDGYTMPSV